MGKPTGFLEYARQLPEDRPVSERICDWNEFHTHFDKEKLRLQGARCMDCGVPFCHTGKQVGRTSIGCPLITSTSAGRCVPNCISEQQSSKFNAT